MWTSETDRWGWVGGATGVVGKTTFRVDLWQVSFKRWRRFIWNYDSPICKLASLHSCRPQTFRCGRIRVGGKLRKPWGSSFYLVLHLLSLILIAFSPVGTGEKNKFCRYNVSKFLNYFLCHLWKKTNPGETAEFFFFLKNLWKSLAKLLFPPDRDP